MTLPLYEYYVALYTPLVYSYGARTFRNFYNADLYEEGIIISEMGYSFTAQFTGIYCSIILRLFSCLLSVPVLTF